MLLHPLNDLTVSKFMDDILVMIDMFEEYITSLSNLLNWQSEVGITANSTKCQLAFDKLQFLGHTVAQGHPDEKNMEKLHNAPRP